MLKLLNEKFRLDISQEKLLEYASQLGSDCPFFITNKASYVTGRGEKIENLNTTKLKGIKVVLINPQIHIRTKDAFSNITPRTSNFDLAKLISQPIEEWKSLGLKNDFEQSIFESHPEIEDIKTLLYQNGASYACMSGSGSTVVGLYQTELPQIKLQENWTSFFGEII